MTIKPLRTNIIIAYETEVETKTQSGLIVPKTSDNNATGFLKKAEVIAINDECKTIEVGDIVLFNIQAAVELPDDKTKRILRTEDVYAVYK